MSKLKHNWQRGVAALTVATLPALAMASDTIDATKLTAGIDGSKPIIIAVAASIFALVGLLVAIRYAKRAAS